MLPQNMLLEDDGVSRMLTYLARLIARVLVGFYGGEGLNLLFRVLPTRYYPILLRRYGAQIGRHVRIRAPLTIHNSAIDTQDLYVNLRIDDDVFIGRDCMIDLESPVRIAEGATLSHRVMIVTHTDAGSSPLSKHVIVASTKAVSIEAGAYIGVNVTILQGVTIGSETVVGAGSLVLRDVPARSIFAGVPARHIRSLR